MNTGKIETTHITPFDIDTAKCCINRLMNLKTEDVAKDEISKHIIDDVVLSVTQYLTSIVERQEKINGIVDNAYKKLLAQYEQKPSATIK